MALVNFGKVLSTKRPRSFLNISTILSRSLASSSSDDVNVEFLDGDRTGVAVCSLTRPEAKNAISIGLRSQLRDALKMLKSLKDVQVMILRSSVPGIFCAGADLKERAKMPEAEVGPFVTSLRQIGMDLRELPMPTIAALDGAALGGGLEFAMCCDIRVAADSAKMGLIETKLAIIPGAGGTQHLSRIVGLPTAKELIFTGRVLDGIEAHQLRLVNHVTDQNEDGDAAYQKALEIAEQIAMNGPIALRLAKLAITKGFEVDLATGLQIEEACYSQSHILPRQLYFRHTPKRKKFRKLMTRHRKVPTRQRKRKLGELSGGTQGDPPTGRWLRYVVELKSTA
ncbi:Methylglutaconyl-CoA hydratase, mitochondrial [Lamellibrachia satsuma]|nr:Methylglutaconyl-CoA hydratase, mitochondrial [Lamellibrachia satsuma]